MSRGRALGDEVARRREAKGAKSVSDLADAIGAKSIGIGRIERYGTHEDASLGIILGNGQRVHFDRQAELFSPPVLMRRLALAGCDVEHLSAPATLAIAKRVIAQADLVADRDALADNRELLRRLLLAAEHAGTRITGNLGDKLQRYVRFREVRDHDPPDDGHSPPASLAIVLVDTREGDRYVRVADVARFLRHERRSAIAYSTVHSLVVEAGWRHPGELWQREPSGGARARVNVYVVPAGWELADIPDTDCESDEEPETP